MRTEIRKVFNFDELNEEAKKNALDKHRHINVEFDWWDSKLYDFAEECKEIGLDIDIKEIEFSLDRDAHFGVRPDGISVNDEMVFKHLKLKNPVWIDIEFKVKKIGYYRTEFPSMGWHNSGESSPGWYNIIIESKDKKAKEKINNYIKDSIKTFLDLCENYYNYIDKLYYENMEDEWVADTLRCNGYEFTEDGESV